MSINTEIYGTDYINDWGNKAKTTRKSIWQFVLDNKLEINKLPDESPCYCGMYKDNYFINAFLCNSDKSFTPVYRNDTPTKSWFFIRNYDNPAGKPLALTVTSQTPSCRWAHLNNTGSLSNAYAEYTNHFIFNLQLTKLLFVPYIVCSSQGIFDVSEYFIRLDEYVTTYHNTYPYINGAYMIPYYNRGTDDSPDWSALTNYDRYFMFAMIDMFSDDFKAKFTNFECTFSLMSTASGRSDYKNYIPILGFGSVPKRDLPEHPIGLDPTTTRYIYNNNDTPTRVKYCVPYSQDMIKEIYKQIAYFGVFFLGEGSGEFNHLSILSDRIYCGTIENGITYGNYTHGLRNATNPQFLWGDTSDSPYDPSTPPETNNWIDFPSGSYSYNSHPALGHWYHTNSSAIIEEIMEKVNEIDLENYDTSATFGLNPIDGILEIKCIFFTPQRETYEGQSLAAGISIGLLDLQLESSITYFSGYRPTNYVIGPLWCNGIFKDFRDYEPYTWASFTDAFCGSVDVAPSKIINRWLTVIQTIDPVSGDKISALYASADENYLGERVATVTGNCAMDLPINGLKISDFQRNQYLLSRQISQDKIEAGAQILNAAAGATISGVSKNPAGAVLQGLGGIARFAENISEINTKEHVLNNTVPSPAKIQNGTSNCEYGCVFNPRLTLGLTETSSNYDEEKYGNLSGFAGYKVATPQSCETGTHIFAHPKVHISGTRQEEFMLIDQLQKGIYVK